MGLSKRIFGMGIIPVDKAMSLIKKTKNLDYAAYLAGRDAYEENHPVVETKARVRAAVCNDCEFIEDEPIGELSVIDERISEISQRMCGVCACALPYLVRQNKKKCPKKRWK